MDILMSQKEVKRVQVLDLLIEGKISPRRAQSLLRRMKISITNSLAHEQ